jgi:hypothetical protein
MSTHTNEIINRLWQRASKRLPISSILPNGSTMDANAELDLQAAAELERLLREVERLNDVISAAEQQAQERERVLQDKLLAMHDRSPLAVTLGLAIAKASTTPSPRRRTHEQA